MVTSFESKEENAERSLLHEDFLTLYLTIPTLNDPQRRRLLENTVGKEENAGNSIFFFSTVFSSVPQGEIVIIAMSNAVCKCFQFCHVQKFVVW